MDALRQATSAALERLEHLLTSRWQAALRSSLVTSLLAIDWRADRRLYALYLVQLHHATSHTSDSQGLVATNLRNRDLEYRRFCFHHAAEELGHEQMVLRDLRAAGFDLEPGSKDFPEPLPATELLLAYLAWIATRGNPVARLGYSYFAERAYAFIDAAVADVRERMGVSTSAMSFYYAHREADRTHGDEVARVLERACRDADDWAAVERAAGVTFDLTWRMIEEVVTAHREIAAGRPPRTYEKLAALGAAGTA